VFSFDRNLPLNPKRTNLIQQSTTTTTKTSISSKLKYARDETAWEKKIGIKQEQKIRKK
jgi:hypothetical protein